MKRLFLFIAIILCGMILGNAQNLNITGNTAICSGSSTTLSVSSTPSLSNCTQSVYMSSGTTTVNCGTNICFYDSGGPNGDYDYSEYYVRTFVSSNNSPITIVFISATGESCCDYISIYDGSSTSATQLHYGLLSTVNGGVSFTSSGNSLTVEFDSDGSVQYAGWQAIVACSSCANFTSYVWNTGQTGATINVSPTHTTTYTVTASGGGCTTSVGSITVNVQDCNIDGCPSVAPAELGTDLTEIEIDCNNNAVTLQANAVATALTTNSYTVTAIPYNPPYNFTAGTRIFTDATDDTWGNPITLPFAFCFYGNTYTQIVPGANSVASFDGSITAGDYCDWSYSASLPSTELFPNTIFACYRDIYPNYYSGDGIYEGILGSYPCRSYVLSFNNIALFSCYDVQTFTSQIVLYEGTNIIDIYLRDAPTCTSWNSGNGVIGIQNSTGTQACVAPNRNTGPWTAHNEAWRFTPVGTPSYTVTWYEGDGIDGPVVGTGDIITVYPSGSTTYTARLQYTACNGDYFDITHSCHVTMNNSVPPIQVSASPDFLCPRQPTTISVTAPQATGYLWNTGSTSSSFTARPTTDPTTYTVTVSYANGCSISGSTTVNIDLQPPVYSGDLTTMDADYANCAFYVPNLIPLVSGFVTDNYSEPSNITITQSPAAGTQISQNTTVTITFTDECGNRSTLTVNIPVGVLPSYYGEVWDTVCQNYPYSGNGFSISASQTATVGEVTDTHSIPTAFGCDSTVILHLIVIPGTTGYEEQTIAVNELPYTWHGVTFQSEGTQTITLSDANGCDSVVTLVLNVLPNSVYYIDTAVCENDFPFTWNGVLFQTAGTQEVVYPTGNGTDSIVRMTIRIIPSQSVTVTDDVCQNSAYSGYGFNVPATNTSNPGIITLTDVLTDQNGCDSTVTLNLTVRPVYNHVFDVVTCDSYTWNGQVYTVSGPYTQHFTSVSGCDSTVTQNVVIVTPYGDVWDTVCQNYPYTGYGFTIPASQTSSVGEITQTRAIPSNYDCDSTLTIHLLVIPGSTGHDEQTIVENDLPYTWNGVTFQSAGTQTATLTDANGCDSVVTMVLNVLPNTTIHIDTSVCENAFPLTWHDVEFIAAGTQQVVYPAANGTDSIVVMTIHIIPSQSVTVSDEVCQNSPYTGYGFTVSADSTSQAGLLTLSHLLQDQNGCDSTVTLRLRVNPVYDHEFDVVACDSFTWNGIVYPESGRYTQYFSSVHGCDSTVTKNVEVVDTYMEVTNLTEDFCENMSAVLEVTTALDYIQWSTGETTPQITVHRAGIYIVTAHTAQCEVYGRVSIYPCPFYMYLPNAITPSNSPGDNDYFQIPDDIAKQIETCEFYIYDRWGRLVFKSEDPHFRWDGTHRGKLLSNNVFTYRLKVSVYGGGNYQYSGTITVL